MRRKMFTCLILALICVISSIPVSADVMPRAIICDECGPFFDRCTDVYVETTKSHRFYVSGYAKTCEYVYVESYTRRVCDVCGNAFIAGLHEHGELEHTPNYCGKSNYLVCEIDGYVYPIT